MHTQLFRNHRHKFVLPGGDDGIYVVTEAFPLAKILGRVELYLPYSDRTVLIDRDSDLSQLLEAFEKSTDGETVGPCIRGEFDKSRLIKVWLDHNPSEEEIDAVWAAMPDEAHRGLAYGVVQSLYDRGEIGAAATS